MRTWGELGNRLDPFYYKKVYMVLENKISTITQYRLRDFIKYMAGGATPKITESEQYYSNSIDGVPFLRVQNLAPEGLALKNCKYINSETNEGLLYRSKVSEDDLLIKITGVGRMAVTVVAPKGFEGNINQHMVVVKTKNPKINEQISTFLNSDIGEMLASRRATGGTRPALDYQALRSIPIILNNKISTIMEGAYAQKAQKEKEAQDLLDGINDYLLQELGIAMPQEEENTLANRQFYVNSENVIGGRFDPFYYQEKFVAYEKSLQSGKFDIYNLGKYIKDISYGASVDNCYTTSGIPLLRIKDLKPNEICSNDIVFLPMEMEKDLLNSRVNSGDILITRSGTIGMCSVVDEAHDGFAFGSFMIKFSLFDILPQYVSYYINSRIGQIYFERNKIGAVQGNITIPTIKSLYIPVPEHKKQLEIVQAIDYIRRQARKHEQEANDIVDHAKEQVQEILLGGKA